MNRVFREEKKYLIGMAEALQRSHLLGQVMREDPHNGVHGYRIRSLYFDTVYDEDYHEKLAGIETRRKIRLRCYDPAAGYAGNEAETGGKPAQALAAGDKGGCPAADHRGLYSATAKQGSLCGGVLCPNAKPLLSAKGHSGI